MSIKTYLRTLLATSVFLIGTLTPVRGAVIYVDDDAVGAGDGRNWANAYVCLQDALADADDSPKPVEIRVAGGIYAPDQGASQTPGDREATFQLINGVMLLGGFAGIGQANPDARDVDLHETILSGDLGGNDAAIATAADLAQEFTRTENSFHVVTGSGTNHTAVLDGFTITGGHGADYGGGMYNSGPASPRISHCAFVVNASESGGAMYNLDWSNPKISDCLFRRNHGYMGGAVSNENCSPEFDNCVFTENYALAEGGAMTNSSESSAVLRHCTFTNNSANSAGAVANVNGSSPTLEGCVFRCNVAHQAGGAICNNTGTHALLANCLFVANQAEQVGGAVSNNSGWGTTTNVRLRGCTLVGNTAMQGPTLACCIETPEYGPSQVVLTNSILWDAGNQVWNDDGSTIEVSYCNIQGGSAHLYDPCEAIIWGQGNMDIDPLFAAPGSWDVNDTPDDPNDDVWVDGDFRLTPCSPCVDSGDPDYVGRLDETDVEGNPRGVGARADIGAHEYPVVYNGPDERSPADPGWRYAADPVFFEAEFGQWDSRLNGPVTVLINSEEPETRYKMWYVAGTPFAEATGIGLATSADGIDWIRYDDNPVLEPGHSWNAEGLSGICVIKDGDVYKLWYEGSDNQGTACIGYATSPDGIHWDEYGGNPVLSPSWGNVWDNEDVGNPNVIKDGATYKMWYWGDNRLTGTDQIGLATSSDGIHWHKAGNNPVLAPDPSIWWQRGEGIGVPQVLKVESGYVMAYHGADSSGTIRIGWAKSSDGLEWARERDAALDVGPHGCWDSVIVVPGALLQDTSHLKLWYVGIDALDALRVGLAICCTE